jgi:hypothetical protein
MKPMNILRNLVMLTGISLSILCPAWIEGQTAAPTPTPVGPADSDPFIRDQPAGPDIEPPELWDIGTGERIAGADLLETKNFGAVIDDISPGGAADKGGLKKGDIILGVDGMRVYGKAECKLAWFRNPMSSTMTLLVNHEGDLAWRKLHDLSAGHRIGIHLDPNLERNRFLAEIEALGLPIPDEKLLPALRMLPSHAAAALHLWAAAKGSSAGQNTAWIQDFIGLYSELSQRQYGKATAPANQPPIPYFQRLEKFYLSLAAANQPTETPPDLAKTGETPEFYALALPIPNCNAPLGDPHFTDPRFNALLAGKFAGESWLDSEIKAAAVEYGGSQAEGLDRYLDKVKASILDPSLYILTPYNSALVQHPVSVVLLIQQLGDRMKDETNPDWPLEACAMVPLKFLAGAPSEAADLVNTLGQRSPYLAQCAANSALASRSLIKGKEPLKALRKVIAENRDFYLEPGAPALCRWALEKVSALAVAYDEIKADQVDDPYAILTGAPFAEVSALKGVQPPPVPAATPDDQSDEPKAQTNGE